MKIKKNFFQTHITTFCKNEYIKLIRFYSLVILYVLQEQQSNDFYFIGILLTAEESGWTTGLFQCRF